MHSMRGQPSKFANFAILDELGYMPGDQPLSYTLQQFKKNPNVRIGFFIKRCGEAIPVNVPPHVGLLPVLRPLFNEHGSGKLYLRRTLSTSGPRLPVSNWKVYVWGSGRTKTKNIKEIDVLLKDVPKSLQLLDMIDG